MQLFCLTYAGGTATFYNQIEQYIDNDIEVIKLEYAGHGSRYKEPFYEDFIELAEDMYRQIRMLLNVSQEYALMGYSMGSISLVELLKIIIEKNEIALPTHAFLAAHEPHAKAELMGYSDAELDEYVKERTVRFGGIPEKLINNKSFWRVYLPIYRNDYAIIGKYDFSKLDLKTTIPATLFYSETDTPIRDMRLWSNYFVGVIEYIEYVGSHFFIQEHCSEMCAIINKKLQMEKK